MNKEQVMRAKYPILILLLLMVSAYPARAAETVLLSEELLSEALFSGDNSRLLNLKSQEMQAAFQEASFMDGFRPGLGLQGGFSENLQDLSYQGQVKSSPVFLGGVSVQQSLISGVEWKASLTGGKRKDHMNMPGAVPASRFWWTPGLSVTVDLWQNFFGKNSKKTLESHSLKKEITGTQNAVQRRLMNNQVRRLYWELVALEERRKVITRLEEAARKQSSLSQRKAALSVADGGEVSLNKAQLAQRQAQLTELDYKKSVLLKNLFELIPGLQNKVIRLGKPDQAKIRTEVLACTAKINGYKESPDEFSLYHKLSQMMEKDLGLQTSLISSYGKPNLHFTASFENPVAGEKNRDTFEDSFSENKSSSQYLLNLTVPLGERDKAREYREQAQRYQTRASQARWKEQMQAGHNAVARQIEYLYKVLQQQEANSDYLNSRLKSSQRKYEQARLDASYLILDQERLMNADLSIISLRLEIIGVLISYFDIFTEFPCEFNKK